MTANSRPPADSTLYARLLKSIRHEIAQVRIIVERQTVHMYWQIGCAMAGFLGSDPAHGTVAPLSRQLSVDLGIDARSLEQAYQFYRVYPRLEVTAGLSWSHYRVLCSIASPAQRRMWERRIVKNKLNCKVFLGQLRDARGLDTLPVSNLVEPPRGGLYYYRIIKTAYTSRTRGGMMVDCGFTIRIEPPPCAGTLANKRVVRSVKEDGGYGLRLSHETSQQLYTYKAFVERVVDGDTLVANVDVGFGIYTRQRLRLSGLDTPELNTTAGQRAKRWVHDRLSKCPFIIIRTHKSDKYDRYLADVFTAPGVTDPAEAVREGVWLNGAILREGIGVVMG